MRESVYRQALETELAQAISAGNPEREAAVRAELETLGAPTTAAPDVETAVAPPTETVINPEPETAVVAPEETASGTPEVETPEGSGVSTEDVGALAPPARTKKGFLGRK